MASHHDLPLRAFIIADLDPGFIYSLNFLYELCVSIGDNARAQLVVDAVKAVQGGKPYDYPAFAERMFSSL